MVLNSIAIVFRILVLRWLWDYLSTVIFYLQYNELCSFSNLSVTSPTSQLILQPFRRFTYVTSHYATFPLHHLRHSSFSNPSFASPTSQALHLIHLASHSSTFPSLHLHHSSFSNPSVASPTSQFIHQPFRCFTYVTVHSPTLLSLLLRHWFFTYVTWRAAHEQGFVQLVISVIK